MKYRILLNERAEGQLESEYLWWAENRSGGQAARWYNGFLDALDGLRNNPERCGTAREDAQFPYTVRELLFGLQNSVTHRALFTIRDDIVFVFSIRHVAQQDVSPEEL